MTEEEKIVETEKSREKYFYVDKERTKDVLTNIATAFIGTSLALFLFGAFHKPPTPPCRMGFDRPMPCPCKMMHRKHFQDFQNPHEHFRGHHKHFKNFEQENFRKDNINPPLDKLNPENKRPPMPKANYPVRNH